MRLSLATEEGMVRNAMTSPPRAAKGMQAYFKTGNTPPTPPTGSEMVTKPSRSGGSFLNKAVNKH
jgi:hypothetical protein